MACGEDFTGNIERTAAEPARSAQPPLGLGRFGELPSQYITIAAPGSELFVQ
jgi:hypothetical protein